MGSGVVSLGGGEFMTMTLLPRGHPRARGQNLPCPQRKATLGRRVWAKNERLLHRESDPLVPRIHQTTSHKRCAGRGRPSRKDFYTQGPRAGGQHKALPAPWPCEPRAQSVVPSQGTPPLLTSCSVPVLSRMFFLTSSLTHSV